MRILIQTIYWILIILSVAGLSHLRQPISDMLSNFYLHFALVGVILFFVALQWRLPRTAIVSVAVAALCLGLALTYDRVSAIEKTVASESAGVKTYKIMTFNAWERVKIMDRLKGYLRAEKPDFVILQEITTKDWRALKSLKDIYPHMTYCDDWLCGVALLSRHKWANIRAGNFGTHQIPLITATFGKPLNGLKLFATHSARPHWKYSTQRQQFEDLAAHLAVNAVAPAVLGGDMNSTVFSAPLRDFTSNSNMKPAGSFTPTWPQRLRQMGYITLPFLQLDIDHFFVKEGMTIVKKWRGPDLGSDHRPLLMSFRL